MSNTAITWARQQKARSSSAKCLLLVLADIARDVAHVSKASGKTWPPMHAYLSIAALSEVTEQDRKTVMVNLRQLEQKGLIERVCTDGQSNQVAVYRLALTGTKSDTCTGTDISTGTDTKNGTSTKNGTVPIFPLTGTNSSADQYQFSASPVPKTGHETILNPIEPNEPCAADAPTMFDTFWAAYPRKVAKPGGRKAFEKLKPTPELLAKMLAAIVLQARVHRWTKERMEFIPHPATWLNGERWMDEVPTGASGSPDRHPQWALNAGFANIDEARNERCYERNAHEFRHGKRIQEVIV